MSPTFPLSCISFYSGNENLCGAPKLQRFSTTITTFHRPFSQYADNSCEHYCRLGYLSILLYNGTLSLLLVFHKHDISTASLNAGSPYHGCSISDSAKVVTSAPKNSLSFTPVLSPLWLLHTFSEHQKITDSVHSRS